MSGNRAGFDDAFIDSDIGWKRSTLRAKAPLLICGPHPLFQNTAGGYVSALVLTSEDDEFDPSVATKPNKVEKCINPFVR